MTVPGRKVALVTGAARGIGEATALRFAAGGYAVVAMDSTSRADAHLVSLAASENCRYVQADVTNEAAVREVVDLIDTTYGRLDVLVNNAGVVLVRSLTSTTWADFENVVGVNLGGTFLCCKHAVPLMQRWGGGAIVNVASVSGHVGQVDHALYGATKAAIIGFVRGLAWELAPSIRVNSVSPGSVDTQMLRGDIALNAQRLGLEESTVRQEREAEQALRRWADPKEIAEAIYFLGSEAASFITGADLLVDGGWVAR